MLIFITVDIFKHTAKKKKLNEQIKFYLSIWYHLKSMLALLFRLWFYCYPNFKLFGFSIFWLRMYLMKVFSLCGFDHRDAWNLHTDIIWSKRSTDFKELSPCSVWYHLKVTYDWRRRTLVLLIITLWLFRNCKFQ
jgi:hypothetical protein